MASEEKCTVRKKHALILEDRKTMTLSGVCDVSGFDEQNILLRTELGALCVKGEGLHIDHFSQETGELKMDGRIDSLLYAEDRKPEGGFFSRLFR